MDISDIRKCAEHYRDYFINRFYIVTTSNGTCFTLIGEKNNFPHLMGINKNTYTSNGYKKGSKLYQDIIEGKEINKNIIKLDIVKNSKTYNKALNFADSKQLFYNPKLPVIIDFDPSKSSLNLGSVNQLVLDLHYGYMIGCVDNKIVSISEEIALKKSCISTWMDESGKGIQQIGKYMPKQNVQLVHNILAFDKDSSLVTEYTKNYSESDKVQVLKAIELHNANLIISNNKLTKSFRAAAKKESINCLINGIMT